VALAHGTYSTAFRYLKAKFSMRPNDPGAGLIEKAFSRFMEGQNPTEFSLAEKLGFLAQGIATGKIFEMAMAGNTTLWKELSAYFSRSEVKAALARETIGVPEPERRAFLMANLIAGQLGYRFATQFIAQLSSARFIESIQTISPLVPLVTTQHISMLSGNPVADEGNDTSSNVAGFLGNEKRAWFTVGGCQWGGHDHPKNGRCRRGGRCDITVMTCARRDGSGIPLKNFQPVGELSFRCRTSTTSFHPCS
jgi:hypothetical protein